jgi:hypothetical protein
MPCTCAAWCASRSVNVSGPQATSSTVEFGLSLLRAAFPSVRESTLAPASCSGDCAVSLAPFVRRRCASGKSASGSNFMRAGRGVSARKAGR